MWISTCLCVCVSRVVGCHIMNAAGKLPLHHIAFWSVTWNEKGIARRHFWAVAHRKSRYSLIHKSEAVSSEQWAVSSEQLVWLTGRKASEVLARLGGVSRQAGRGSQSVSQIKPLKHQNDKKKYLFYLLFIWLKHKRHKKVRISICGRLRGAQFELFVLYGIFWKFLWTDLKWCATVFGDGTMVVSCSRPTTSN